MMLKRAVGDIKDEIFKTSLLRKERRRKKRRRRKKSNDANGHYKLNNLRTTGTRSARDYAPRSG